MKILRDIRLFIVLLCAVIFGGIVSSAFAQPAETNALEWREIPVKNIRPGMLAYWIDPAHQTRPVEFQKADDYIRQSLSPKQMLAPLIPLVPPPKTTPSESSSIGVLQSPAGVSTIFADNANNVIWARSTPVGFDKLKQIVAFLDRKIRKINFDFKIIEVDSPEAEATQNNPSLKKLFEVSAKGSNVYVGTPLQSTLDDLIKNGDAKIVKSSQFTILNNLTDKFTTATSVPVTVAIKQADDGTQLLTTQADKDNPLFLEKRLSVIFTPTLNNDDTITIFMTVSANAELTYNTPTATDNLLWVKSLQNGRGLSTVFTIHDGDSILFTGYNSTMLGLDNQNHPILFSVKAQIEK